MKSNRILGGSAGKQLRVSPLRSSAAADDLQSKRHPAEWGQIRRQMEEGRAMRGLDLRH